MVKCSPEKIFKTFFIVALSTKIKCVTDKCYRDDFNNKLANSLTFLPKWRWSNPCLNLCSYDIRQCLAIGSSLFRAHGRTHTHMNCNQTINICPYLNWMAGNSKLTIKYKFFVFSGRFGENSVEYVNGDRTTRSTIDSTHRELKESDESLFLWQHTVVSRSLNHIFTCVTQVRWDKQTISNLRFNLEDGGITTWMRI